MQKTRKKLWAVLLMTVLLGYGPVRTEAAGTEDLQEQYREYQEQFDSFRRLEDVEHSSYRILEDQVFPVTLESFGEEELTLVPALEDTLGRLALFIIDMNGEIRYKCDRLETNECVPGQMKQLTSGIASIAFADVNRDHKTDIVLITRCVNPEGAYAGIPYKVGDVLFQGTARSIGTGGSPIRSTGSA